MNKQEIPIPEGYDVLSSEFHASWNYGTNKEEHVVITRLEKKQTKDFSFYVDQYLYENGSTNDQIVNWLSEDIISIAKHRLKTSQFSLVPWEIKIGLCCFICNDIGIPWYEYIHQYNYPTYFNDIKAIESIIPDGFRDDIINKTKN